MHACPGTGMGILCNVSPTKYSRISVPTLQPSLENNIYTVVTVHGNWHRPVETPVLVGFYELKRRETLISEQDFTAQCFQFRAWISGFTWRVWRQSKDTVWD